MTWKSFLSMVNNKDFGKGEPSELTLKLLKKFWNKFKNRPLELAVNAAVLVNSLVFSEVW